MRKLSLFKGDYTPKRTTELILHGSFIAVLLLAALLVLYDVVSGSTWLGGMLWVVALIIVYLVSAKIFLRKNFLRSVNWMIIAFYLLLAFCTLLLWGVNAPVGILTVSFAVALPSILLGPRSILPVVFMVIVLLSMVQLIHSSNVVSPDLTALSLPSTSWDILTYSTIISVFALVSWIASNQRAKNLERAIQAEEALRAQKDALRVELDKESATLRSTQLKQIRQLYNFALLGQSTAATLHELSNHLSILNLDIEDLHQHTTNSKAIANAKSSIDAINTMVRQSRQQLNSFDPSKHFNAVQIVHQAVKDMKHKYTEHHVALTKEPVNGTTSFNVKGNSLALMQAIIILLNNALDACCNAPLPAVSLTITTTNSELIVSIKDNGIGISPESKALLFKPIVSTKATGLGVGLYIAHHIIVSQFGGTLKLKSSKVGANFVIKIPKK